MRDAAPLSLAGDDAIVEYVPGDLTLTARAGASLAENRARDGGRGAVARARSIRRAARERSARRSRLHPAGPLAHAFGTPRDNVLGVEAVTGTGDVVRAGGRVVKNVAGFDLTRLFTGAWGTLAVITEATVRLRARPERDETIALALPPLSEMEGWLAKLRALPFSALALELLDSSLSRAMGLGERAMLLARLGGNDDSLRAQLLAMRALGDAARRAAAHVARARGDRARGRRRRARVGVAVAAARALGPARRRAMMRRSRTRPSVAASCAASIARPRARPSRHGSSTSRAPRARTFSSDSPNGDWSAIPARVNDPLSRAVRTAFDPRHVLNRGILGEVA